MYNKKAKDLADKMKKNLINNSKCKKSNNPTNVSFSVSRVSINNEEIFDSELDIVEHLDINKKKPNIPFNKIEKSEYTIDLECKMDNITPEKPNPQILKYARVVSAPSNKNNIQKFMTKDKPVQPNKRDYSPMNLQKLRLEKQLRNNVDINKIVRNNTINKNSVDFLNEMNRRIQTEEFETNKKEEFQNPNIQEGINNLLENIRINTKQTEEDKNLDEFLPADLFKSLNELNDIKKNLKVMKFLDKK